MALIQTPWNQYESAILIDAYLQVKGGKLLRNEAIAEVSKRLRGRMLKLGMIISDTYRNENGIAMQMSAIDHGMDEEGGITSLSNMFRDMIDLYQNERGKFEQILAIANTMYPSSTVQQAKIEIKSQPSYDSVNEHAAQTSFLAESTTKYVNKKIKHILETKFNNGYRLGSRIEYKKLLRYFREEHGYELNMEMEDVDEDVKVCGIVHESRVYLPNLMLTDDVKQKLVAYIEKCFNAGQDCVYYSVLYDEFHESFLDNQVYDEKMLKEYLSHIGGNKWYFRQTYFSDKMNVEANILADVISFVKEQGIAVSEDEVVNGLSHLPEVAVRRAFNERETGLISSGRKLRFHIDNFLISEEELERTSSIIAQAIELYHYISFGELLEDLRTQVPSIIDNNSIFTEIGIRKVLAIKLEDRFSFVNSLISSKANPINTEDAFRSLAQRETFTSDDVKKLADDCGSIPNVYIDLLLNYSVRINKNDYIAKSKVTFDVAKIDEILSRILTKDYIAINDIVTLSVFPDCGYSWTSFLLESYAFNHSKFFKILHADYFSQTNSVGGIIKKASSINDFETMVAHAVIDDHISLKKDDVINYMYDKGYIAQHRYKDVTRVIDIAIKINKQ